MSHPTRRDMEEKITLRSTTFHHVAFDFIDGVISVPGLVVCSKKTRIDFLRVIALPGRQRSTLDVSEQIEKMRAATAGVVFALRIRRDLVASLI